MLLFLERVLLLDPPSYETSERERWRAFVMRWQQFTGRVMAKGVEDTAFYQYNRLVSLNEVGGEPGRDDFDGLAEFHARNSAQREHWPHTLNATSTHDTKRSEDVRARIHVLSEIPELWAREVRRWSKMNAPLRSEGIPHPNEELLIYQTLAGMWPLDAEEHARVPERLQQYVEKAAREAKTHTSWIAPNAAYEQALRGFAGNLFGNAPFMAAFQLVLKATTPGVPDFYQGTELWDFSLVDPDNRRPVDFETRRAMLGKLAAADPPSLLRHWADGRIKLFVTQATLAFRAGHPALFGDGAYTPLDAGENVVAFTRTHEDDAVIVAVPRFLTRLVKPGVFPIGERVWSTAASLPSPGGRWRNIYTGETIEGDSLPLRRVLETFPVAVLERA